MLVRNAVINAPKTASKAPSGLQIIRDDNKLALSWKIPESKYDEGQQLQYRIKDSDGWGEWTSIAIGKTTTKKVLTIPVSEYYPVTENKLAQVRFRVRGVRESTAKKFYTWSDWADKVFDVQKPNRPSLNVELSSQFSNVCTFSWETETDTTSEKWFERTQLQTILVKNCSETDGSKLKWKSSTTGWGETTGNAAGSIQKNEDTALLANASYTRWFRARSQGPQGNSEWRYAKHVYAAPNMARIVKLKTINRFDMGIYVEVEWAAAAQAEHPIDETIVQSVIAVPRAGTECPADASWQNVDISKDTGGKDAASFIVDDNLDDNECLWIRVNTKHDSTITYGVPTLARRGILSEPSGVSVTTNPVTFKATITATNNSPIQDAFLAVSYRRPNKPGKDFVIGIIEPGETSVTVQCPNWTLDPDVAFGVYACVGSYIRKEHSSGINIYAVTEIMESPVVWQGGNVPMAPGNVTAKQIEEDERIHVTWDWTWEGADSAELSWADHSDAWESTEEPETYVVGNMYASAWNIYGLSAGKKWYVRVRLIKEGVYGPYSKIASVVISTPPVKPTLNLSNTVVRPGRTFKAHWTYESTDGTDQRYSEICVAAETQSGITYGDIIAHTKTGQEKTIVVPENWQAGNTYLLCLRVTAASGKSSDWSDPVAITVAEPLTAVIADCSLEPYTYIEDEEAGIWGNGLALRAMPLRLTVTGAGDNGTTIVIIERATDYHVERPDESDFHGYKGETIVIYTQQGEEEITIRNKMLTGFLDDGAKYRIRAIVKDELGQSDEKRLKFDVRWQNQALIPDAKELLNGTVIEVTPIAPEGARTGDRCDIYRLSADRPVLIVERARFGQTYVDPYPAIGDNGGHRVVYKTVNGDYITQDDSPAWVDMHDEFDFDGSIIDFGGEQIMLRYNLSFTNSWEKDFTETKYLGGSVQGDWNRAVSRKTAMSATTITVKEEEAIEALRKLAVYPGICHVRTPDGSSFTADIQVSESRTYENEGRKTDFTLSITRVDPEGLDGMTLEVWEAEN